MSMLDIPPGTMVGLMLRYARELFNAGIRDKELLLEHIQEKHATELCEQSGTFDEGDERT